MYMSSDLIIQLNLELFLVGVPRPNSYFTSGTNSLWSMRRSGMEQFLKDRCSCSQVVIIGESLGGVYAFHLAKMYPDIVKHLLLVNPATCYSESSVAPIYETISQVDYVPDALYSALAYLSLPLFMDPLKLGQGILSSSSRAFHALGSLTKVGSLADLLTPSTLKHRLDLLRSYRTTDDDYKGITIPVTAIVADNDMTMPTLKESERIVRLMPNATRCVS